MQELTIGRNRKERNIILIFCSQPRLAGFRVLDEALGTVGDCRGL